MDRFRKALLGAASLLALTASGQKSADAAVPPTNNTKDSVATSAGQAVYADPLFELTTRTNGSLQQEAVESALREMFPNPSPAQAEAMPKLLAGLSGLGASSDVVARSRAVLIELVSNAQINNDVIGAALSELQQGHSGSFKMAAADDDKRKRRRRRPDEIGQTGAPAAAS